MTKTSLLGSTTRVETPYVKVKIGDYTFGVFDKKERAKVDDEFYVKADIKFPNYVKSLGVEKINGKVNTYTLQLEYAIRPQDDPNFIEKVFSSVSEGRKIYFTYGDMSLPEYIYKEEEAIITKVTTNFNLKSSSISYNVSAISCATLGLANNYYFPAFKGKPSNKILEILYNNKYGLCDIFYGMVNKTNVHNLGLIPSNDAIVDVGAIKTTPLEYIKYLTQHMVAEGGKIESNQQNTVYVLTICDEILGETVFSKNTEVLGGPYFKISQLSKTIINPDAYYIDIGYPSHNIVINFQLSNDENYSIYYNWNKKLNTTDYVYRLDKQGNWVETFSPSISSNNDQNMTHVNDSIWWSKLTQYPVSAIIELKGLIRPATLMEYVKLNVYFYGNKHISTGTYIVTKQVDRIDSSGYRTTLSLTRIGGE